MKSTGAERSRRFWASAFNLPNQLTFLRLILAAVMFCVITWEYYLLGFVLFVLAAGTDWLDGYFARKYSQVTTLGRILDPFADKVIICGTFIFLTAIPEMNQVELGLRPWMVVVLVGRELLVTALRSFLEDQGGPIFSAQLSGKLKMVLQCLAAGGPALMYLYLGHTGPGTAVPAWIRWTMVGSVWVAVISTVYSGLIYMIVAGRLVRSSR